MSQWSDKNQKRAPDQPKLDVDDAKMTPEEFAASKRAPEPPPPEKPTAQPPKVADTSCLYRVLEAKKFRMGTVMARFEAGQVLNATHYMPEAFREILAQVKTEPVKG
jgi:hypothetical protein